MNNIKLVNITFGEIIKSESGDLPELEVIVTNAETNERIGTFWLYYLRKYCMQVGGKHGQGDHGSTKPIESREYNDQSDVSKCEILRTAAVAAVNSFVKTNALRWCFRDTDDDDFQVFTNIESMDFNFGAPKRSFFKFIKASYQFAFPNDAWPYSIWDEE